MNQVVQALRFILAEAAGGFIEHQYPSAACHRGGNLNHLLMRNAQLRERSAHVQRHPDLVEHFFRAVPGRGAGDESTARRHRAETEILGD